MTILPIFHLFFLYLDFHSKCTTEIHKKEYESNRQCDMSDTSKTSYHMVLCFREWDHPYLGESSYDHHHDRENKSDRIYPKKWFPVFLSWKPESIIEEEYDEIPHHPESKDMTMDSTEYGLSFEISSEFTIGKSDEETYYHREHREASKKRHNNRVKE